MQLFYVNSENELHFLIDTTSPLLQIRHFVSYCTGSFLCVSLCFPVALHFFFNYYLKRIELASCFCDMCFKATSIICAGDDPSGTEVEITDHQAGIQGCFYFSRDILLCKFGELKLRVQSISGVFLLGFFFSIAVILWST